ncbi:MAG: hypothetical protein JJ971_00715 [Balneolaceae bacterium]|nr:hypothetical protein [Balneolaceae bacterium]MBO6544891.1 hypothetical protein [Balneolaceae bacterium]MBO6646287.1 hypothetical protein [Balneolaceae bacterium]
MKKSLYNTYYKFGLEYFINKKLLGLHKPNATTNIFYLGLILVIITIAQVF